MATQDCVSLPVSAALTLVLVLLLGQPLATAAADDNTGISLIRGTCNHTEYPQVCISTLEADQRSFTADLPGLCRIATELSAAKANDTLSYVTQLVNSAKDYAAWANLAVCRSAYDQTAEEIAREGLPAIDGGDYKTAHQIVGLVNQAAADCGEVGIALLSERNKMVSRLTANTMTMLHLLF